MPPLDFESAMNGDESPLAEPIVIWLVYYQRDSRTHRLITDGVSFGQLRNTQQRGSAKL